MPQDPASTKPSDGASVTLPPDKDPKAMSQSEHDTLSRPGGFENDPADPTNPNEEIERHKEKLRPQKLRSSS
jgi:hypothetical protein